MAEYRITRKRQAKTIRTFRKIHRTLGVSLFVFFALMACTGLLLGWKANSAGLIIPDTQKGTSTNLQDWMPIDELTDIAIMTLRTQVSSDLSTDLDRIDSRPGKGVLKFIFEHHYWEIQLDGATGKVLSIAKRNSDLFEDIHDGSIVDKTIGFNGKYFKLLYTTTIGTALLGFVISGFWLWYGPKFMKKYAQKMRRKQK